MHVRSPRVRVAAVLLLSASLALAGSARIAGQQAAQKPTGFRDRPSSDLAIRPFRDADVESLLKTLDAVLAAPPNAKMPGLAPDLQLWKFTRWLQSATLTPAQEAHIVAHLQATAEANPQLAPFLERTVKAVQALTLGKVAPEIEGNDPDGIGFRLSDYRGRIVVLTFGGEWCGICRAEYPYERFLNDLYKDRPFAILNVNSDGDVKAARRGATDRPFISRAWWDGYGEVSTAGPIATSYAIYGWPTTYLLDEDGVIRYVDLRQEDLLKGVRQLMSELTRKTLSTKKP